MRGLPALRVLIYHHSKTQLKNYGVFTKAHQTLVHLVCYLMGQNLHGNRLTLWCRPTGHDLAGVMYTAVKLELLWIRKKSILDRGNYLPAAL